MITPNPANGALKGRGPSYVITIFFIVYKKNERVLFNSLAGDPQHHIFSKTARSQFSCKTKIIKIEPRSSENEGQTSAITSTKQTKTQQYVRLK